jgi:hypothetical protein
MNKSMMGWGAIIVGVLMILTEVMAWPGYLNYIWSVLVLIWGAMAFKG